MNKNNPAEDSTAEQKTTNHGKTISRAFWITILALFAVTISMGIIGALKSANQPPVLTKNLPAAPPYEPPSTTVEAIFKDSAEDAQNMVSGEIGQILDGVYAPVYGAIPEYTSYHYSVLGEYVELSEAVFGDMEEHLRGKLFEGFEERMLQAGVQMDQDFLSAFQNALQNRINNAIQVDAPNTTLGPITRAAIEDATNRMMVTLPMATVATAAVGSGALGKAVALIATRLAAKIAAKAAIKGIAKRGGVLTGVGGGALACSWSGPGALVCGVVGGVAAWFFMDAVVINLDEYFNREDFEEELRLMIDADRAEKELLFTSALERYKEELSSQDFTLREMNDPNAARE